MSGVKFLGAACGLLFKDRSNKNGLMVAFSCYRSDWLSMRRKLRIRTLSVLSRRLSVYLLTCLFVAIVAIAIIEGFLRVAGIFYERKVLYMTSDVEERTGPLVLCLGDSHVFGIGAPPDLSYPRQLQALLNKSPRNSYQVVNLGHAGYNSSQAVDAGAHYVAEHNRKPAVIVFTAGKNNGHNYTDARILSEDIRNRSFRTQLNYLLRNSRAYRFSWITQKRIEQALKSNKKEGDVWIINQFGDGETEFLEKWLRRDLTELKNLADRTGAKLLLVDYLLACSPVYHDTAKAFAEENDLPFLDIGICHQTPLTLPAANRVYGSGDGTHPNAVGYALVAESVYDAIERLSLENQ